MENFTDQQLVTLYLDGNQKAFDGIVNRYTQTVYRFVLYLLNNQDEARDITQDTFIKAWKNIDKYDLKRNFKTWLFIIAKRITIDYLRRKHKNVSFSSLDDKENDIYFEDTIKDEEILANEIFENNENAELIKNVLEKISLENKTIILLHNGEEMTFQEISEILNKSINTIKSQYRRSIIQLKKYIEEYYAPKV